MGWLFLLEYLVSSRSLSDLWHRSEKKSDSSQIFRYFEREEPSGEGWSVLFDEKEREIWPNPAFSHDCMDAGGTTTRKWEVEFRLEQESRVTHGAVTE